MSAHSRGRTPERHAAVILTAVGLDQQPGDPWGACETVAGALGLIETPPPQFDLAAMRRRRAEKREAEKRPAAREGAST